MSNYPDLVRALQQRRTVVHAPCIRLDFASETRWLWPGVGPLRTANPGGAGTVTWQGVGALGRISDVERMLVPTGGGPILTLSGVDPSLVARTLAASSEVKGRPVRIFEQYFDPDTLARVDQPVAIYSGLMDRMKIKIDGPSTRTITLTTVTLLYRRRRPACAYLSDADQRALYAGDYGASEIPALQQRTLQWPNY